MLKFYGKAKPTPNQLRKTVEDGLPTIEIQLFDDFKTQSVYEVLDLVKQYPELVVSSVHSPLLEDYEIEIEEIVDTEAKSLLLKTCYLAELLALEYNREVNVVIHTSICKDIMQRRKDMTYAIAREVGTLLELFENITICLENVSPLVPYEGRYETRNNFLFDGVWLCKFLRETLQTTRVGTVLDICHAQASIEFIKSITAHTRIAPPELKDYFVENGEYTKIIHFNNSEGFGYYENHGIPYDPDNEEHLDRLENILNWCNKYTPEAQLVMEICEEDYVNGDNRNKLLTLQAIDKLKFEYQIG